MKVLCIGHTSWDMTVPVDEYPVENAKYRFNEKYQSGGGPASNAAYLLGKWGVDTIIATNVGSDDLEQELKKNFKMFMLILIILKLVMKKIHLFHILWLIRKMVPELYLMWQQNIQL